MFSFLKKYKRKVRPRCAALVAAAGSSSRMGGVNKLLEELEGIPVLARTLMALQSAEKVDEIIIATREDSLVEISQLCKTYSITKCSKVVQGGETRVHSVLRAAMEVGDDTDLLAVQDGARPLVTPKLIDEVISAARRCSAAAPAVPVKDTVKQVKAENAVEKTLDRAALRAVQTPQVFDAELLRAALQSAIDQELPITDDCSAVELMGKTVYLVEGEETNIKITTPTDLIIASAFLREREGTV